MAATEVPTADGAGTSKPRAGTIPPNSTAPRPGAAMIKSLATGAATIDGTLTLTTGFVPNVGNNFTVVTGAVRRSWHFATVTVAYRETTSSIEWRIREGPVYPVESHPMPVLTISDESTLEGDSGAHDLVFTVTLAPTSPDTTLPDTVTVDYATSDDTATQPGDYASTSGALTFLPTETSKQIGVSINGDGEIEADEEFLVLLSNPHFVVRFGNRIGRRDDPGRRLRRPDRPGRSP